MKATVYINAQTRTNLVEENVEILSITPLPKITKKGQFFQRPYDRYLFGREESAVMLNQYKNGIRSAKVKYSDGTICDNVWVNMKDIIE